MMSELKAYSGFKLVRMQGITAIILNSRKVLVMKRLWLPFIIYPGAWTFVAGHKESGESEDETAYREVFEEAGIARADLALAGKYAKVLKIDEKRARKFYNTLYLFRSRTKAVRKNVENTAYRWATLADIRDERLYTNVFANPAFILKVIRKALER